MFLIFFNPPQKKKYIYIYWQNEDIYFLRKNPKLLFSLSKTTCPMRWIKYIYMVMCNRLERMGKVVLFFYHHQEWVFGQGQERYISVPFYFFEKRNFLSLVRFLQC